ncbi:MAG: hemolysin III family protein [Pyrinomonadaceae bacterium]|nr:hemolysin III family protein [Acidobacteriota bacterium]MBP7375508.1 hemolysin III family protein [Pyrinomonadaceae bacterium]
MIKAKLKVLPIEELANTITHGFGLMLSVIGLAVLVVLAGLNGDRWSLFSCVVYGLSLVVLYAASTFYHSATSHRAKKNLQVVDHCCIYLLIAGSYTPFGMVIIDDPLGRSLMAGIWGFAAVGILVKLLIRDRFPAINVISYLLMGWLGVFAVQPLFNALGLMPVALTIAGGVAYSLGVVFFPWTSIKHHHAIFHVFILLGSIIHYAAVVLYVVPHSFGL